MSSPQSLSDSAPANFPRLDVLSAERIGQPEQGKESKAFSVAFPKLHALATTNYKAAEEANLDINTRVLNEVKFNNLIDAAIKKLDVKNGEDGYQEPTEIIDSLAQSIYELNSALECKFQSVFQEVDIGHLTREEIKTRLLTAKINAQSFAKYVVGLTNLAESFTRTALQSKKVEWTNLGVELEAFRDERDLKIASANSEYKAYFDLLAELETLLIKLSNIDDRTPSADIDEYFHHFVALTGDMKELYGTGHELADSVKDLLDQLDGSPESKINFYNDLLKPESDYLRILVRSAVFARRKVNEKAPQIDLANREMRSEKFDEFNLRFSPTAGIIFRDIFNKINNFTCEWALVSKPISWLKESLIDRSKSSVCATALIVAGVFLYVIFDIVKAAFALSAASTAYVACSIFWAVVVGTRFMIGQGYDKLKDHFQKKNQVRNNSNELQGKINSQTRPNELLAGLRTTKFYKAYEAQEAARLAAEAAQRANAEKRAEIIAAGERAERERKEKVLEQARNDAAIAARDALLQAESSNMSMVECLNASRKAGKAAHKQAMLRSARVDGQRSLMGSAKVNGQRSLMGFSEA